MHEAKAKSRNGRTADQITQKKKKPRENSDDHSQFLVRRKTTSYDPPPPLRSRSTNSSPSAWALSPGRSQHPLFPSISPSPGPTTAKSNRKPTGNGVTVSGVFKYFSSKVMGKASPAKEEEYHRLRIAQNRLLQWRFANARAEQSASNLKRAAHRKLFGAWLRVCKMRNHVVGKEIELQRLIQAVKLFRVISSEMCLLNEWGGIERRNCEAVGRLERKLLTISNGFLLVHGAKGELTSIIDELSMATNVMDDIQAMVTRFDAEVERMCFLLTELSVIVKESKDSVYELEFGLATAASLQAREAGLRVDCMELAEKSNVPTVIRSCPIDLEENTAN